MGTNTYGNATRFEAGKAGWAIFNTPGLDVQDYAVYAYDYNPSIGPTSGTYLNQDLHSVSAYGYSITAIPFDLGILPTGIFRGMGLHVSCPTGQPPPCLMPFPLSTDLTGWTNVNWEVDDQPWTVILGELTSPPINKLGFGTGFSQSVDFAAYYTLDANSAGVIETINNIANLTVVSRDANDLKAEYRAGFIQGKLQGHTIISARDNSWDNAYLTNPSHTFPKQLGPTQAELTQTGLLLNANYAAFLQYVTDPSTNETTAYRLKRLLFRMLGIYHGATFDNPPT